MSQTAAPELELPGMPERLVLRRVESDGQCLITFGDQVLFWYDADDAGMRNLAVVALTDAKVSGRQAAEVFELTPEYVSRLRGRARTGGSAALVQRRGRPPKLTERQVRQARIWAGENVSQTEIAARLRAARSVISDLLAGLGPIPAQQELGQPRGEGQDFHGAWEYREPEQAEEPPGAEETGQPTAHEEPAQPAQAGPAAAPSPTPESTADPGVGELAPGGASGVARAAEPASTAPPAAPAVGPAGSTRIGAGVFRSRYAGAMLTHAFGDRIDAGAVLAGAAGGFGPARFDDVGLLVATSIAFGLGAATVEQIKHLTSEQAGPLCGLARLPDLRTLRPRLAGIADRTDPLALQRAFATAMLHAEPGESQVYLVDDHFVPYHGAKPVPKGWNTKRRTAQRGRADTWVSDQAGRAICFTTGEPSGLTKTLPAALAELRAIVGPNAKIMLAFDRGGAYPQVFSACRDAGADWITYRRAPLAVPTRLPVATTIVRGGKPTRLVWCEETVCIDGYGDCRQLTVFEHGAPVLQVLTCDTTACPAELLSAIKSRWRIENAFKYADHYGIDSLCDYLADIETNTRLVDNPARKTANTTWQHAKAALADAERALARLLADQRLPVTEVNKRIKPAERRIAKAAKGVAKAKQARDAIPARLPANQIDPTAKRALLRTSRRGLQMVLRLLAYNAEHWLAGQLNAYLQDDDEYRAITRQTITRGLAGTITYTTESIIVTLDRPDIPKIERALSLLIEQLNNTPPRLPGDPRPITYTLSKP